MSSWDVLNARYDDYQQFTFNSEMPCAAQQTPGVTFWNPKPCSRSLRDVQYDILKLSAADQPLIDFISPLERLLWLCKHWNGSWYLMHHRRKSIHLNFYWKDWRWIVLSRNGKKIISANSHVESAVLTSCHLILFLFAKIQCFLS